MRTLTRVIVVLGVLLGGTTNAQQNIAGNWQGTLQAGKELRIVFVIAGEGSGLKATMHSIDQGGQGIPVNTITLQGTTLRMSIAVISGTFEGTLSADGNTISGHLDAGRRRAVVDAEKSHS